jgi:hypothetical protein
MVITSRRHDLRDAQTRGDTSPALAIIAVTVGSGNRAGLDTTLYQPSIAEDAARW